MPYTLLLQTAKWEPAEQLAIFQSTHNVQVALMCTGGNLANITHVGREAKNQHTDAVSVQSNLPDPLL